ncbi:MAG TPA: hypothetical protein VIQ76_14930 [Propionibacteriaceae bacterium]|jgi:hypothetical protein
MKDDLTPIINVNDARKWLLQRSPEEIYRTLGRVDHGDMSDFELFVLPVVSLSARPTRPDAARAAEARTLLRRVATYSGEKIEVDGFCGGFITFKVEIWDKELTLLTRLVVVPGAGIPEGANGLITVCAGDGWDMVIVLGSHWHRGENFRLLRDVFARLSMYLL